MYRCCLIINLVFLASSSLAAEETFVTIHQVSGNRLAVTLDSSNGRGGGMRAGMGNAARGRRGQSDEANYIVANVPELAKITTAMRERRTFEFRVGGELAGGLKHDVFRKMKSPISARIVTEKGTIVEVNVIVPEIDINQSGTTSAGQTVIAVRPKRPPTKKQSAPRS